MPSECILLFSNGFHNSQRVFIIHPNDENLFERKQRYDIILSIEYILSFSNGFYNSQCIFIIHLNDIIESFRLKESKEGEVSSECILSFSNGFHNSQRVFIIQTRIFLKESRDTINYVSGEYNSVHRMYSVFEWIL